MKNETGTRRAVRRKVAGGLIKTFHLNSFNGPQLLFAEKASPQSQEAGTDEKFTSLLCAD